MLKNIVAVLMGLSFAATANAAYEIQISNSFGGTGASIDLVDKGGDTDSYIDYGVSGELYLTMSEQLQVGGIVGFAGTDRKGPNNKTVDDSITIGALMRYNLSTEMRDSLFVGGGIAYNDFGDGDSIGILLSAGKRFALSDSLTWTPNVSININVAGDEDEGSLISLNLISFSGFMD